MAKTYICDACGMVIPDPHPIKMKEFNLAGAYEVGAVLQEPVSEKKEVHLCNECFHALHMIATGKYPPKDPPAQVVKIKYLNDQIEKLEYIGGKSDWIDLRAAEDVSLKNGEYKLIPLGIAMQLPAGYEAHIIPRSSTFSKFGVIQANHMGLVDESYCGDNDQWYFPAIALKDTEIHAGDRICQFRIEKHQPSIKFEEVESLGNPDRGGLGSTGVQ